MRRDGPEKVGERLAIQGAIQVAGVQDEEEAYMLVASGVDYVGFPLGVPVHTESATESSVARIIRTMRNPGCAVLITYLEDANEVSEVCRRVGATVVQLHGQFDPHELHVLKGLDPTLRIIKSIVVGEGGRVDFRSEIRAVVECVDAFIVDTLDESTGARGATGKTHDWGTSRAIVDFSPHPVILAGGLSPTNVRKAIYAVGPAGVDVHTGVENSTGRKDRELVRAFVSEARDAFKRRSN